MVMKGMMKMSNMSYCRFRNTLEDFIDCVENLEDNELSKEEALARYRMVKSIADLAERYDIIDEAQQECFNPYSESYQYKADYEDRYEE